MINYQRIRRHYQERLRKPSPARGSKILVLGFALIILTGSAMLTLPAATDTPGGLNWLEALFTATSAVTVTGLVVVGTEPTFSTFGEIVILILIQVGGVGFITLSVLLFRLIGRRVTIYERILLTQTLGVGGSAGVVRLTVTVLLMAVSIELVGALLMFTQFAQVLDWPQAAYYAIFHAVSAFCNAGFDLFHGLDDPVLQAARYSPLTMIVMAILITIGTLGIAVIYDLLVWPRERHLSLHTRLVLPLVLFLTVAGTLMVMLDETYVEGRALAGFPEWQRWLLAFFTVVSSRTAGLTFVDIADMGQTSQLMLIVWMFIGGAPASMGGGVGLTTVAVVLVTLFSNVRGYNDVRAFHRILPTETILKAVAILTVSTALVVSVMMALLLLGEGDLLPVAFEVISAFSNTGYSFGITAGLNNWSRALLVLTMFWGRLGPLTLVVALAQRRRQTLLTYPEEKIIIG